MLSVILLSDFLLHLQLILNIWLFMLLWLISFPPSFLQAFLLFISAYISSIKGFHSRTRAFINQFDTCSTNHKYTSKHYQQKIYNKMFHNTLIPVSVVLFMCPALCLSRVFLILKKKQDTLLECLTRVVHTDTCQTPGHPCYVQCPCFIVQNFYFARDTFFIAKLFLS